MLSPIFTGFAVFVGTKQNLSKGGFSPEEQGFFLQRCFCQDLYRDCSVKGGGGIHFCFGEKILNVFNVSLHRGVHRKAQIPTTIFTKVHRGACTAK